MSSVMMSSASVASDKDEKFRVPLVEVLDSLSSSSGANFC
jgi:hypothetical protein